jgi:hypothetical protein
MWQRRSPPQQGGRVQGHMTCGGAEAHTSREAGSGAVGHVVAPEPTVAGRQGPGLQDTWWHQSPPQLGGSFWSHRTHVSTGAHPSWEAASGATGHVSAHGSASYPSLWLHACMRGYPVYRVPTVAPRPTSGEAMNLQVGPSSRHAAWLF